MNHLLLNKKSLLIFLSLLYTAHSHLFAQQDIQNNSRFWENVRFGGSLGANFNNAGFSGYLAPKAIYDFNRFTSAGLGLSGSYTNTSRFSAFTTGASLIALLRPINPLQVSAEFEENYVTRDLKLEGAHLSESYWYPALFLGLGYTTGPVTVGIKYDVLYDDDKSIYSNALMPFFSIYF